MKNKKKILISAGVGSVFGLAALVAPMVMAQDDVSFEAGSPAAAFGGTSIEFGEADSSKNTTDVKIDGEVLHGSWGPQDPSERPTYEMNRPATEATFNSITDATNSAGEGLGDERQFVRIYEIDPNTETYRAVQFLDLEAGKKYQVVIYYHNNASSTYNFSNPEKTKAGKGVAANTKVASWFPRTMKKGETGYVVGKISWTVYQPGAESQAPSESNPLHKVWASATVTAKEDIELKPINGKALLVNGWNYGAEAVTSLTMAEYLAGGRLHSAAYVLANGANNDGETGLFSADGTFIQSDTISTLEISDGDDGGPMILQGNEETLPDGTKKTWGPTGVVLGCNEYAGRVTYQFETVAAGLPSELPETGALQIVLAGVLMIVVAGGVAFMMKTRTATRSARGRK